MHPAKAIRHAATERLVFAGMAISVGSVMTSVTVSKHPPAGAWIPDADLPGVYVYVRQERVEPGTLCADLRIYMVDIVLQAKGGRDDVLDQIDDLQFEVENALLSDFTLGGLVYDLHLIGSEIYLNQGEVVFGARKATFEARCEIDRFSISTAP
jgi:hypothetical protein